MTPQQPINLGANTDRATPRVALNDDYENNVVRNGPMREHRTVCFINCLYRIEAIKKVAKSRNI